MEENKGVAGIHKVILSNRSEGVLTGVTDVLSFDTEEVLMDTTQGRLTVKGKELHVKRLMLEKGEVEFDGRIDSLNYSDTTTYARKGESIFKRLFQ